MMVVATSTSYSWFMKASITRSSSASGSWPWPTTMRAEGQVRGSSRQFRRWSRRGCGRRRPGRRAPAPSRWRCAPASRRIGDDGLDGHAVFGRRLDDAHIAQADQRHVQRARNGRGGHGEHVDLRAHLLEALLVAHAEALFLIDDQQAEVLELESLTEWRCVPMRMSTLPAAASRGSPSAPSRCGSGEIISTLTGKRRSGA